MWKASKKLSFLIVLIFACIIYGSYQYILVDIDYIFLQQPLDEYSVDVSKFRVNANSTLTKNSGILEWDKVVEDAQGKRIAYIADDCKDPLKIYGVGYLVKGKNSNSLQAIVQVNYTSDVEITAAEGEAYILIKFGKIVMLDQMQPMCSLDEETLNCPIPKGFRSYYRKQQLPKYAPRGMYRAYVELRYKDTKEIKLCAKGQLRI